MGRSSRKFNKSIKYNLAFIDACRMYGLSAGELMSIVITNGFRNINTGGVMKLDGEQVESKIGNLKVLNIFELVRDSVYRATIDNDTITVTYKDGKGYIESPLLEGILYNTWTEGYEYKADNSISARLSALNIYCDFREGLGKLYTGKQKLGGG